jgi:hypothetical protein
MISPSMRRVINESQIMEKGKHSDINLECGKEKTNPVVTGMVTISVGCGW